MKVSDVVTSEQLAFAHKGIIFRKTNEIGFLDINSHPFTVSLYPIRKDKNIYVVSVRSVKECEESPYYGTLEDDGRFGFIYPSKVQTQICFPYDVSFKLHNLVLTEIGMLAEDTELKKNVEDMDIILTNKNNDENGTL